MSCISTSHRFPSRPTLARSDCTYSSFNDIELHEPFVASPPTRTHAFPCPTVEEVLQDNRPSTKQDRTPSSRKMQRKDSGYESMGPRPSELSRRQQQPSGKASSSPSVAPSPIPSPSSPSPRRRTRAKVAVPASPTLTGPVSRMPRNTGSGGKSRRRRSHQPPSPATLSQDPPSFFQFPNFSSTSPHTDNTETSTESRRLNDDLGGTAASRAFACGAAPPCYEHEPESPVIPYPQTTHYWTSDSTRRLEYAAIDAASQGVRGWFVRHLVPDCFVPKDSNRRLRFGEDDTGSVIRYRLELEDTAVVGAAEEKKKNNKKKKDDRAKNRNRDRARDRGDCVDCADCGTGGSFLKRWWFKLRSN